MLFSKISFLEITIFRIKPLDESSELFFKFFKFQQVTWTQIWVDLDPFPTALSPSPGQFSWLQINLWVDSWTALNVDHVSWTSQVSFQECTIECGFGGHGGNVCNCHLQQNMVVGSSKLGMAIWTVHDAADEVMYQSTWNVTGKMSWWLSIITDILLLQLVVIVLSNIYCDEHWVDVWKSIALHWAIPWAWDGQTARQYPQAKQNW